MGPRWFCNISAHATQTIGFLICSTVANGQNPIVGLIYNSSNNNRNIRDGHGKLRISKSSTRPIETKNTRIHWIRNHQPTMTKTKVHKIFELFREHNPNPETELDFTNNFELLVAVILSAQATDVSVNKVTPSLFKRAPDAFAMAKMSQEEVEPYIKTIGLFHSKAKNIVNCAKELVEKHNGEVPSNRKDLEALPGVGRKTANVVLSVAFGEATLAVDTHIFRVSQRIGLAKGKTPLDIEKGLLKIIPEEFLRDSHHWLILHGRYICKARKPDCPKCFINELCEYKEKTKE